MTRKLIIDGNAVYEIDETCMLKRRVEREKGRTMTDTRDRKNTWKEEQKNKRS